MGLWKNPANNREWVYVGTDNTNWEFATISRLPIDAPGSREVVWNTSLVSIDNFQVSADGRYAGAMLPWPHAGIADLQNRTVKKLGQGCWPALTSARGPLFWYFDGAHRNLTMVDVEADARWMVNINNAPGFDGAEVDRSPHSRRPRGPIGPLHASAAKATGGPAGHAHAGRLVVNAWLTRPVAIPAPESILALPERAGRERVRDPGRRPGDVCREGDSHRTVGDS